MKNSQNRPTVAHFIVANQLRTWPRHDLESGHLDKTIARKHCILAPLDTHPLAQRPMLFLIERSRSLPTSHQGWRRRGPRQFSKEHRYRVCPLCTWLSVPFRSVNQCHQ